MTQFVRPLFTCGAYNPQAQRAVMYNTANATCYTFDDLSALLVGELLAVQRETAINTSHIAEVTGVTTEQVEAFCHEQLMPIGLVHDHVFSDNEWQQYRQTNPPCLRTTGYEPQRDYMDSLPKEEQINLVLELTYACSERCLHCFNEGAARGDLHEEHRLSRGMLNLANYQQVIDEAAALGIPEVTLTGGDPFSHPDCWAILDELHKRNIAVNLQTNALALNTSEKIRRVARMGLKQLCVSIYSADAAVHDRITRRQGSWEQSMHVLKELSSWPVPLSIKTPIFRLNSRTYYGVRHLAREVGAETDISCVLMPGADGDVSIIEHLQTQPEALRLILNDPMVNGCVNSDGKADGYDFGQRRGMPCSANRNIVVSPTGIARCCTNLNVVYGQLPHASLREIILSPKRLQLLQGDQKKMFPTCGQYDYCQYCPVPCFAGERLQQAKDGTWVLQEIQGDACLIAKMRMEVSRQIEQGIDPLGGKSIEACLSALPVEGVPVFSKKIRK
jgi:MoaA/NifB/PqqE/SkfB family radical SAM enzyme